MSKMKEINDIAQGVADVTLELMQDSVEWQIANKPVEGDAYFELKNYVISKAIELLYKQNTTPIG